MGTRKIILFFLSLLAFVNLQAQDYVGGMEPSAKPNLQDKQYPFFPSIFFRAGTSFSLLNVYQFSMSGGLQAISLPPASLLVGWRKSQNFSLDLGFNYESYNINYNLNGGALQTGYAQRLNIGLRGTSYFKISDGNYITGALRAGWLSSSGLDRIQEQFGLAYNNIFFRSQGLTFQIALGHEYRFSRNSALHYEIALGNPYYLALGYVHHFELSK